MATRVTMPPLEPSPAATSPNEHPAGSTPASAPRPVPVAKVQLLNDRGDREAEARWLAEAARAGVVELLSTSPDPFTIVTAHAGSRTMRTARLAPEAGLATLTEVTELLSRLHHDGFVHGKLTVDHVIIGPDGPVLCSPDGNAASNDDDLHGLARCMRELARQWDESKASCPWRAEWDALAQRLEDGTDPSRSAIRTVQALRRMSASTSKTAAERTVEHQRIPRGFLAAACAITLAIAGITLVPAQGPAASAGPHIVVDGWTYAVGQEGDEVALLDTPCDPDAPVVVLRPTTGEVWAFADIGDGATSAALAVVPGATDLRVEHRELSSSACTVAVARGPAGATDIDTVGLRDDLSVSGAARTETN